MKYLFSSAMDKFQSSAVRDILKLTQGKSIISFAGGLPAEELFPLEAVQEAYDRVFAQGKGVLQYGLTEGCTPLREALCERMRGKGMNVTPNEMILTTGSQQAIDLLTRVMIDPGDRILVQEPTYLAALQVFQAAGAVVHSVKGDEDGMDPEDLAAKLKRHQPKFVYVVPTFSNPTGYVWSTERRLSLLKLCHEHNALIIEDDPYGELQYGADDRFPSILSLDEHPHGSAVVYTSTFSKTVAPALRTGWAIGDPSIIRHMARAKQAADLHSSTIDQLALYQLLSHFDLDAHIRVIRREYGARMKTMTTLLKPLAAAGLRWNEPKGGMFLWAQLPEHQRSDVLMKEAVQHGVAFVPGATFFAENPKHNAMRLNFTHANDEQLALGVERLATAMKVLENV